MSFDFDFIKSRRADYQAKQDEILFVIRPIPDALACEVTINHTHTPSNIMSCELMNVSVDGLVVENACSRLDKLPQKMTVCYHVSHPHRPVTKEDCLRVWKQAADTSVEKLKLMYADSMAQSIKLLNGTSKETHGEGHEQV